MQLKLREVRSPEFREKWDALEERGRMLKKERDALFKEMEALRHKIEIATMKTDKAKLSRGYNSS